MKLAIIVRKDLDMRTGKIAGQVGHASVTAYRCAIGSSIAEEWFDQGQKKIVLKVSNEGELNQIASIAKLNDLQVCEIRDFGLTQIAPDTLTCISIGPDNDDKINKVIKDLKLF